MEKKLIKFKNISFFRKCLNIVLLILILLIALELILRLIGLIVSWREFHDPTFSDHDAKNAYVICCVGDSWTGGRIDSNYRSFLYENLKQKCPKGEFKIINLASAGHNSSQQIQRLIKNIPVYHPSLVIALIGNNDHWNLTDSNYWLFLNKKLTSFNIMQAKIRIFIHSLRIYKLFHTTYFKIRGIPTPNEFFYPSTSATKELEATRTSIDRETHRKQLYFNLVKLIELSREYNFKLILQTYIHFHGYNVNEIIRDVALSYQVPLVDNNLLFHKEIASEKRAGYFIPDGHPNSIGYKFMADKIMAILEENKILQ